MPDINTQLEQTKPTFEFDRSFQEKILQAMIMDHMWAAQFTEVLEVDYFHSAYLKLIADKYINYYFSYKEFPSLDLLLGILKKELKSKKDDILRDQVKQFFVRVASNKELGDLGYVKVEALDFCKKQALMKALSKSIDLAKNTDNHEKIVEEMKQAISAGNSHTPGLSLLDDVEARYSETYRSTVKTGIRELDQRTILNGGLGGGELGIVVAPTGVGKSHFLVQMGASAIRAGKNVAHYTFELNERNMGIRYDSNLLDIGSLDCFDHKEEIKEFYQSNEETLGSLRIKYYPTSSASVQTLRMHLEKLAITGFVPDLVIVDYAGIMRSADRYELLRLELKKVCEELRSFATELAIPVWTALQSNKEGADKEVVDLTNMAESYGQAHVADFVVGLSRQSAQKATGIGNLFVAKNRAGMDGIKYRIHLDTSKSKLRVLTDAELSDMSYGDDTEDGLAFIRKKYATLNKQ